MSEFEELINEKIQQEVANGMEEDEAISKVLYEEYSNLEKEIDTFKSNME